MTGVQTCALPISIVSQDAAQVAGPSSAAGITPAVLKSMKEPGIPMRRSMSVGTSPKQVVEPKLTWGVQFELLDDASQPNKNQKIDASLLSFSKYFPTYQAVWQNVSVGDNAGTVNVGGAVLDSDLYNNNFFTLERVEVITGSNDRPDPTQWAVAAYRRNGNAVGSMTDTNSNPSIGSRFLDPAKDFGHLPTRDRKSTRLNSSHMSESRMPSSA